MRRVQGGPLVGPCFLRRNRRSAEIGRFNVEPDRRDEHPLGRMPGTRSPAPFGFVAAPPEGQARIIIGVELVFTAQYLRDDRCRTSRSTVSASGVGAGATAWSASTHDGGLAYQLSAQLSASMVGDVRGNLTAGKLLQTR